jgi:hypothetical protein
VTARELRLCDWLKPANAMRESLFRARRSRKFDPGIPRRKGGKEKPRNALPCDWCSYERKRHRRIRTADTKSERLTIFQLQFAA